MINSIADLHPLHSPVERETAPAPFPLRITIELSAACNLSCIMCPRKYAALSGGFMERGLFEKIVDELSAHEVEAVVPFFRGEALLHPDFLGMITLLRKRTPARIQLATNALLLTPALSKALLDIGIDFISFSLDAVRRETYEKIRVGGDFDRAMENVHTFLAMRKHTVPCRTVVQVSATESLQNEKELLEFIRFWTGRVDRVRIYPRHSEKGRYGRLAQAAQRRPEGSRGPCRKPFSEFVIYADGQAALCNHDWDRKRTDPLGSIRDQGIEAIWNGDNYAKIRQNHVAHKWQALSPCGLCDHWQAWEEGEFHIGTLVEGVPG